MQDWKANICHSSMWSKIEAMYQYTCVKTFCLLCTWSGPEYMLIIHHHIVHYMGYRFVNNWVSKVTLVAVPGGIQKVTDWNGSLYILHVFPADKSHIRAFLTMQTKTEKRVRSRQYGSLTIRNADICCHWEGVIPKIPPYGNMRRMKLGICLNVSELLKAPHGTNIELLDGEWVLRKAHLFKSLPSEVNTFKLSFEITIHD